MPIVKHLKNSNWRPSPKTPSSNEGKQRRAYVASCLLASWIGTYLDLYCTGRGLYFFPQRPFPSIFSIDIVFTIIGLPIFSLLFIFVMERLHGWGRGLFTIFLALLMSFGEQQAESIGLFVHTLHWKHEYSLAGYMLFLAIVWRFYRWMRSV
ncbi:CBO0543 family protein [Anoxybacteroides tepidamans]|uniref:CBO0543 family protein n=1 Tax=Anoxybacteroides tepidamans TaxID=265948 RepID=UPI00048475BF|nr:CBO0543 family protein [Anoxybacillus tepidamans]